MRAVLTRVKSASVVIDGQTHGSIGKGFLVLLGVHEEDTEAQALKIADKICGLRIFEDENGKMNVNPRDAGAELLIISQFTLFADCRSRRPGFSHATRMVLQEIRSRYSDVDLSVDSLAKTVHFSPVYLGSVFKEETGLNIRALITSVRLEAACRLLLDTNLPIGRIARQTGFNSANYFARQFRQSRNLTPIEYRENGRNRKEEDPE